MPDLKSPFVNAAAAEQAALATPMDEGQFRLFVVQALTELKTQMRTLLGNGRPGSIERLSSRVRKVELKCAAFGACSRSLGTHKKRRK